MVVGASGYHSLATLHKEDNQCGWLDRSGDNRRRRELSLIVAKRTV
jgi:hypothetical protein